MALDTQFQAYERTYSDTLTHLFDLARPFIVDAMAQESEFMGNVHIYKRIGKLTGQAKTGRNEIASLSEPEFTARQIFWKTYYCATPLDKEDVIKMVDNPQDDLYQETVNAIYRLQTQVAMASFFADVVTGEDGGSTSSFDTTNNRIAVNYSGGPFGQNSGALNVGLTIDKLLKIKSKISNAGIMVNTNANDQLNIAVCEDDVQKLMANLIGTDNFPVIDNLNALRLRQLEQAYNNITNGTFDFLGFKFHQIPPEYFTLVSTHRRLPVWVKDGAVFGIKENVATEIIRLPETVESVKVQALTRVGGLRKHDSKVYDILAAV